MASEDSFCRSCALRSSCLPTSLQAGLPDKAGRTGEPAGGPAHQLVAGPAHQLAGGPALSPGSLVAYAAAYFLLPLVAAIVGAAVANGAAAQVASAGGGFVGAVAAVTVATRLLRARNVRRRPGAPGQMKV